MSNYDFTKFIDEKSFFQLPDSLRGNLAKPMGELYSINHSLTPEEQVLPILRNTDSMVITVGDVVTESLLSKDFSPHLSIIDNQTLRGQFKGRSFNNYEKYKTHNPQATIQFFSWKIIHDIIDGIAKSIENKRINNGKNQVNLKKFSSTSKNYPIILEVEGEEDLLVIPCVLEAPLQGLVLYGQPKEGIVLVTVTNNLKERIGSLVKEFKVKTSVQS